MDDLKGSDMTSVGILFLFSLNEKGLRVFCMR